MREINYRNIVQEYLRRTHETLENKISEIISNNPEYFKYIPVSYISLFTMIEDLMKNHRKAKTFIDIGCGSIIIPKLMNDLGFESSGLEYDEILVKIMKCRYFENNVINVIHSDLLTYEEYNKFDVLYSYNPIISGKLMFEGVKHIISKMKKNSIFYFINTSIAHKDLNCLGFTIMKNGVLKFIKS